MLKNIMISMMSILGVLLALFFIWFFAVGNGPEKEVVVPNVETSETMVSSDIVEEENLDVEVQRHENLDFFNSDLKIISID